VLPVDAAQRFAVNRERLPPIAKRALRPPRQHRLELLHIQSLEDPMQRGYARRWLARKAECPHHGLRLFAPPLRDSVQAPRTTEHGGGCQRQNRWQRMAPAVPRARVGHTGKCPQ